MDHTFSTSLSFGEDDEVVRMIVEELHLTGSLSKEGPAMVPLVIQHAAATGQQARALCAACCLAGKERYGSVLWSIQQRLHAHTHTTHENISVCM